jgi:hypothetical protein
MLITETFGRVYFGASEQPVWVNPKMPDNPARHNKVLVRRGNMQEMIPIFARQVFAIAMLWAPIVLADAPPSVPTSPTSPAAPTAPTSAAPLKAGTAACLPSGDGYLRASVAGAINTRIDWPNSGTKCEGESRDAPPGVRLSFQRAAGGAPNLLLVFGLTGVREGQSAREVKTNLTLIVQGTSHIYGTLGDARCTVDSLSQTPLAAAHSYRLEARGFCTQPAHAVRGKGDVLVSTFEFAGYVTYDTQKD